MKIKKSLFLIARVAVFGALAIILYMVPGLQFPIFPGLPFLKIHFDEIPVLFASLAYGPLTGTLIIFLKGLFKLIQDIGETGGIGVLADIIYGLAFILPASFIYKYHKNFKMGLVAIFSGMFVNLIFSSFIGYYLIYPLYGFYFNPSASSYNEAMNTVFTLFKAANSSLTSWSDPKILFEFLLPFNLIKDSVIVVFTILVYKPLSLLIKKNDGNNKK